MADSSFEMEFYSPSSHQNHLHLTPTSSHFGTSSSSHHRSHTPTPRRTQNRPPATPFASDNDMSWQGELSWQFEPTSWHASSNLSAALNPWTPMPPSESRIFRRSANDYSHSRSKGFRDFRSPYHDYSGYGAVSAGRLVLQSYVARGGTGSGPLATKDELNMIKYESQEHEFLHGSSRKVIIIIMVMTYHILDTMVSNIVMSTTVMGYHMGVSKLQVIIMGGMISTMTVIRFRRMRKMMMMRVMGGQQSQLGCLACSSIQQSGIYFL